MNILMTTSEAVSEQEPKTISFYEYRRELRAYQELIGYFLEEYGFPAGDIEIVNMEKDATDHRIQLGVNWSAEGTKSVDETLRYAAALEAVAELCESFPYNGYEYVWI